MSVKDQVISVLDSFSATIASGASLSVGVNLGGLRLFGVVMPSAWTAAGLTFQASFDGGTTWVDMVDSSGAEIVATVAASRFVALDPATFSSVPMLKLRSGTSASAVAQGADRAIQLILRSV